MFRLALRAIIHRLFIVTVTARTLYKTQPLIVLILQLSVLAAGADAGNHQEDNHTEAGKSDGQDESALSEVIYRVALLGALDAYRKLGLYICWG